MPHDAEEGYLEFSLVAAALDYKDAHGKDRLAELLSEALAQIGLKVTLA